MSLFSAIGGIAGGIAGISSTQGDKDRQEQALQAALAANQYNTEVAGQGASEFNKIDPTSRNAMLSALSDYQNKARMGGLDAVARANLEETQGRAAETAARTSHQIQNQAARMGTAQGPASMVAQQVAAQQAGQNANQGALGSAALAEQARMGALQGQMGAAQNVYGMDANKAAAQDAINRFNVQNAQMNVANKRAQVEDTMGVNEKQAAMYGGRAGEDVKQFSGMGEGLGGGVDSIISNFMPGGAVRNILGGGAKSAGGYSEGSTDYLNPGGMGGT